LRELRENHLNEFVVGILELFLKLNKISLNKWIDMKIQDDDINYFKYNEFSNMKKVGEGASGIVKEADWKSCGIKVALMILENNPSINEDNMKKFLKEVI
jgi:hypothetical protein